MMNGVLDKISILKKTAFFQGLGPQELRALAACAVEKRLRRGEILFTVGQQASGFYVLAKGMIRAFRQNPDGREQVIHVEKAPATFAEVPLFDGNAYPSTVAAEEECQLLFLEKAMFLDLCRRYPLISLSALRVLSNRLRHCADLVESLSLREVGPRIAELLLEEAQNQGKKTPTGWELRLPSHGRLAARVGSVREVVSRTLARMEQQGFLKAGPRRNVFLLNEKELRRYTQKP